MKFSVNTVLGVGGILSMVISPVLAFSGIKTDVEVVKTKVVILEDMKRTVDSDHDLIIAIGAKLGVAQANSVTLKQN